MVNEEKKSQMPTVGAVLNAIRQRPAGLQLRQPIQLFLVNAIRPRAYDNADDMRMGQRLQIQFLQTRKRSVSI